MPKTKTLIASLNEEDKAKYEKKEAKKVNRAVLSHREKL